MANRLNYSINDILENAARGYNKVPRTSKITPIVRMGVPARSVQSQMAEAIKEPTSDIGYVKGGNIATGLANALKSGLAVYGAFKDRDAQQAYNDNLAQIAEQERQDKLAQQEVENQYKRDMLAQQYNIAKMNNEGANSRALQQHQWALEAEKAKRQQAKDDQNLSLRQRGIDPELYGQDAEYTALVNDAIKQQELRDQVNTASIELGKSGKVGMDKVRESVATGNPITYGDNSWLSNVFGVNKYGLLGDGWFNKGLNLIGLGKKPQQSQVLTPSDITRAYRANQQQNAMAMPAQQQVTNMSNEDLLKGL